MAFFRLAFCVPLVSISVAAMAADKPANTPSESSGSENALLQSTSPVQDITALTNPFLDGRLNSDLPALKKTDPGSYSLSDLNGDVCYTMRSYKVKRTERLRDDQSGRRGYTTCEMAASYRVRSAKAKAKDTADRR